LKGCAIAGGDSEVGGDGVSLLLEVAVFGEVAEVGFLLAGLLKVVLQLVEVVGRWAEMVELVLNLVAVMLLMVDMLTESCDAGSRGLLSGGGRRRGKKVGGWRGW
jgi:hypothetical protein